MPLIITYKDSRHHHAVQCDEISEKVARDFIKAGMIYLQTFNLLEIDLSDENCERAACYHLGSPVCEFGGAAAWNIYQCVATIWPDINYHTAGRPPLTPHNS